MNPSIENSKKPKILEGSDLDLKRKELLFYETEWSFNSKERIIYFTDDVELISPIWLSQIIRLINQLSDEADKKKPITLEISSYGGDIYGCYGLVDIVRTAPVLINTRCFGTAMSAAAVLLVSGTGVRSMGQDSYAMIHQISSWYSGKVSTITNEVKHLTKLQNRLYELFAEFSNKDIAYWKRKMEHDFYLTAEQCLEFELIDEII
jgi:ATP-dependent Clp protease, protease subunit